MNTSMEHSTPVPGDVPVNSIVREGALPAEGAADPVRIETSPAGCINNLSDDNGCKQQSDDSEQTYVREQMEWLKNVYQGDRVPQLTFRAVLVGGLLGSLMSISNLYTSLKLGWAFGVAITACVLSFVIWNAIRVVFRRVTPMSILENNCMQSTASAAGYSTGATIGTAFGAYLLITGQHIRWEITLAWTLVSALLGVLLAVPMKRQMINREKLPFPSGIAAATTLQSLYGGAKEAIYQAYSLVFALVVGGLTGISRMAEWVPKWLKLPELVPFEFSFSGQQMSKFFSFGWEPSVLLIAAGMIVGLRVSASMLLGSLVLYLGFGPWLMENHIIASPAAIIKWSLWTGTTLMVTSGLTAFAVQWKTVIRALGGVKQGRSNDPSLAELEAVEVPGKWFLIGAIPLAVVFAGLEFVAFSINPILGVVSVVMSFFLALVACRATGETDITPIGPMGKIAQLTFAVLSPANITTNLMAASATANIASSSADLLTDLKSGYLLGANARKQFQAQLAGVFFGAAAIVPAWYLMVPDKAALEKFNPPSTNMYKAVAEALSHGIQYVPETARWGILIGGVLGIMLALVEHYYPKSRKYTPSAMGLGLSWIMGFSNCLAFFIGAAIAAIWSRISAKNADTFVVPVASGAIAGESLACALIAISAAVAAIVK